MKKKYGPPVNENEVRYCTKCGELLLVYAHRILPFFNDKTGQEEFNYYHFWKCPSKTFWFDGHDDFNDAPVLEYIY